MCTLLNLSQLALSDHVRVFLSETCLSELMLSETILETLSDLHLLDPLSTKPGLSDTLQVCTYIFGIIGEYINAKP